MSQSGANPLEASQGAQGTQREPSSVATAHENETDSPVAPALFNPTSTTQTASDPAGLAAAAAAQPVASSGADDSDDGHPDTIPGTVGGRVRIEVPKNAEMFSPEVEAYLKTDEGKKEMRSINKGERKFARSKEMRASEEKIKGKQVTKSRGHAEKLKAVAKPKDKDDKNLKKPEASTEKPKPAENDSYESAQGADCNDVDDKEAMQLRGGDEDGEDDSCSCLHWFWVCFGGLRYLCCMT